MCARAGGAGDGVANISSGGRLRRRRGGAGSGGQAGGGARRRAHAGRPRRAHHHMGGALLLLLAAAAYKFTCHDSVQASNSGKPEFAQQSALLRAKAYVAAMNCAELAKTVAQSVANDVCFVDLKLEHGLTSC